jgi:hypothetical protein
MGNSARAVMTVQNDERCESYDSGMTVTASGITFHKGECAVLKVQLRNRINFRCTGDPGEGNGTDGCRA